MQHPRQLRQLTNALRQGAVIAYPTETVWGLGCLPHHTQALRYLAQIKKRPLNKGFILLSSNINYCRGYIHPDFWPLAQEKVMCNPQKPTTWLVPKSNTTSELITGQHSNIAIRISPHPFIKYIGALTDSALISTSANINKRSSLNSALLIQRQFGKQLDAIVHGYNIGSGKASQIIDLQTGLTIRA